MEERIAKSDIPSELDPSCNTNPLFIHPVVPARNAYGYSQSGQPLDVLPQEYQPHNNTFNIEITAENQRFYVPGVLDLNPDYPVDQESTNTHLISSSQSWTNSISTQTGGNYKTVKSFAYHQLINPWTKQPPHEASGFADNPLG
jgi:hypothetical protein